MSLDSVINGTSKRFQTLKNASSKFSCLDQKYFNNALDADNVNKFKCRKLTINNVLKFMRANDMCSIYPSLSTLYHIFLTLPISSASVQRSLSRLKLIKSYLRSTMTENRLSGLAFLSIERQFATELDYDKVMDYFSKMKPTMPPPQVLQLTTMCSTKKITCNWYNGMRT